MEIYKRISSGILIRWSIFYFLPVFVTVSEVSLQETVEGFIGGSAVLPCSSEEPPLTIQDITVRWRFKYSQNVFDIINGQVSAEGQDQQYKNRVESFPEEYLRGNFSIKLNNLQHIDAGVYECYIFMNKESVLRTEKSEKQIPSEGTKPVFVTASEVSLQEIVEGFIGGSAVLNCSSEEPPITIQDITVRWRNKYSQDVYDIINGQGSVEEQDQQYKNRVESFPEEYLRGNFSIKLYNLQHTDAGEYYCYIFMKEPEVRTVKLLIKEKSERLIPSEGTKPRPEMTVMIISILFIGIISSLANSVTGVST